MKLILLFLFPLILLSACSEQQIIEETSEKPIEAYFCKQTDCEKILAEKLLHSENTKCAFYSINSNSVKEALEKTQAQVVIDYSNKKQAQGLKYKTVYHKQGIMHNKFCILNKDTIITGSYNPHSNTANNLVIIPSTALANNYLEEFSELWGTTTTKKTKHTKISLNTTAIENYFCPEDNCREKISNALSAANKSIIFMTYSFTDDKIGQIVSDKAKKIMVKGILDKSQINKWSQYNKLRHTAITQAGIHHKVFIVDESVVITGSANPTNNGYDRNDENILIIRNEKVAKEFIQEFELVAG